MADVVFNQFDVKLIAGADGTGSTPVTSEGTAGNNIGAGDVIYLDSTTGKMNLTDANNILTAGGTAGLLASIGVASHPAYLDQPIKYFRIGDMTFGNVLTQGQMYILSANAGKFCPISDLVAGMYLVTLLFGFSSSVARMSINATGVLR